MNGLIDFFIKYQTPIILIDAIIVFVVLLVLIKISANRRKKQKELEQVAADKVRDENLNNVILNKWASKGSTKEVYTPYDVDYSNKEQDGRAAGPAQNVSRDVMLRLVEHTELSTRKFILNPAKRIRIGSDLKANDISVMAEGIAPVQCEIFSVGGNVYIRNIGEGSRTILRRKREQAIVNDKGILLESDDVILLGKISYDVTIVY